MSAPYTVWTSITRLDAEDDPEEIDVEVTFEVTSYLPGYRATDTDPGAGAEYEFAVTGMGFGNNPDPAPLSEAEIVTVGAWFRSESGNEAACQATQGYPDDCAMDRGCDDYHRYRDEQMESPL